MAKKQGRLTIGADPEFFLADVRTGTVTPAIGLIGGTKDKPIPIAGLEELRGYTMQEDNVMVEFNIPPCTEDYEFVDAINRSLSHLDKYIADKTNGTLVRDTNASRLFGLASLEHPQAKTFGCSPDFDAYAMGAPAPAIDAASLHEGSGAWRFAGGHIHVGYVDWLPHKLPYYVVAHFLDFFVGASCAWDAMQGKRGELYGSAGRFRPTPYGIEYRSLSNLWLHDQNSLNRVASSVYRAMSFLRDRSERTLAEIYGNVPWHALREAMQARQYSDADYIRGRVSDQFPRANIRDYF